MGSVRDLGDLLGMCSPVGHSLLGAAISLPQQSILKTKGWLIAASVLFANLPDIDHVLGWIQGDPMAYHRQATHSILFAIVIGGLIWFTVHLLKKPYALRWGVWGALLIASHLLLDYFAKDTSDPAGIPLFWPFIKTSYHSPVWIFSDLFKSPDAADFFQSLWVKHNMMSMIREALILGPILLIVWLVQRYRQRTV